MPYLSCCALKSNKNPPKQDTLQSMWHNPPTFWTVEASRQVLRYRSLPKIMGNGNIYLLFGTQPWSPRSAGSGRLSTVFTLVWTQHLSPPPACWTSRARWVYVQIINPRERGQNARERGEIRANITLASAPMPQIRQWLPWPCWADELRSEQRHWVVKVEECEVVCECKH